MCVLRDTYLVDDPVYREEYEEDISMQSQGSPEVQSRDEDRAKVEHQSDKPALHLVMETVEETAVITEEKAVTETTVITEETEGHIHKHSRFEWQGPVTAYYWCRVCKQKTPATLARSCDCGVTMCNSCWEEWDLTCPICDSDMSN